MKLLGAHTFSDAACSGGQARSRRLGRLRVLAGFPQREIKKGRRPSARGSRAKIIKTRARFAAAASLSARSRRFISGYTSVPNRPPARLPACLPALFAYRLTVHVRPHLRLSCTISSKTLAATVRAARTPCRFVSHVQRPRVERARDERYAPRHGVDPRQNPRATARVSTETRPLGLECSRLSGPYEA